MPHGLQHHHRINSLEHVRAGIDVALLAVAMPPHRYGALITCYGLHILWLVG
jgi:hypothetical protein